MSENMDVVNTEQENNQPVVDETPVIEEKLDEPAADQDNESNAEENALPEPDLDQEEGKKRKEMPEWVRKRLEKERREAESLRAELERYKAAQVPSESVPHNDIPVALIPKREDFDSDEAWAWAVAEKRDELRLAKLEAAKQQHAAMAREEQFREKLTDTIERGRAKYSNFDEVVEPILYGNFPTNRPMAEAIFSSPYKDDILMYLGQRFDNAKAIAQLDAVSAIKEIARIETLFEKKKSANVTKAPKPLTPVNAAKGNVGSGGDPNKMDMNDFKQWYAQQYNRA